MNTSINKLVSVSIATFFFLSFSVSIYAQRGNNTMISPSPVDGVTFRFIEANDLRMRIAEAGDSGPLLLLAHGWPESWYSWRHQLTFFAEAGYRVVAPDMRGYGETDKPPRVEDYDIVQLANMILSGEYAENADLNSDGSVNILDIVQIVNIILSS